MATNVFVAAVVLSTALFFVVALPTPEGEGGEAPAPAPAPPAGGNQQGGGNNNFIDCKQFQQQCTNQSGSFNASAIPMSTPAPAIQNEQIPQNQSAICQNQQAQLMCSTMTSNMNVTQIQNINQFPTQMPFNASGMPTMPTGMPNFQGKK